MVTTYARKLLAKIRSGHVAVLWLVPPRLPRTAAVTPPRLGGTLPLATVSPGEVAGESQTAGSDYTNEECQHLVQIVLRCVRTAYTCGVACIGIFGQPPILVVARNTTVIEGL